MKKQITNYLDSIPQDFKDYFNLLEGDFPHWLNDYINTKEMLQQRHINAVCGIVYTDLFNIKYNYSSLDHSIGVALIIWHFTKDKKQTLAGLFHDISTPSFKHCIDFLNGDYMTQESTEELTKKILSQSKEISALLKRDKIELDEVCDYHIYPIADNSTPKLCADRLEYSLSNALLAYNITDFETIEEIYNDLEVQTNEENELELGFKTKSIARKFVKITSQLSVYYRDDRARFSMQFLADVISELNSENIIRIEDLYSKSENEIIEIIKNSKYRKQFDIWQHSKKVKTSTEEPKNVYYVHHGAKVRYIDPLVKGERISKICKIAKKMIDKNLAYNMNNYVYLGFDLN